MYRPGDDIKTILNDIQRNEVVLPGIQRDFVWQPEQIYRLFDSLMQGYPFGTFLYWRVAPENSDKFNFYDFVLNYHQRDNPHCPRLPIIRERQLTAVLDGQQRLTALNIGLRGSMAWKLPRLHHNNPTAFPKRRLYLDLLWRPKEDDEEGQKYRFEFLTQEQVGEADPETCWYPVWEVLSLPNAGPAATSWLTERLLPEQLTQLTQAHEVLFELFRVVRERDLVAFYEEKSQEIDKVLQIFIRTNDGGTPLSHSDLLLSTAVAQWTEHDAKEEIHALVDDINRIGVGFSFSKDLVLKAGLMLSDIGSVGFKVANFNRENMGIFERKWDDIKRALLLTVQLASTFGFNDQNLRAHNAILPIAYYLYLKDPGDTYLRHRAFEQDRQAIREWLIRSLLKSGVWGSGLDTLLTAIRAAIKETGHNNFPLSRLCGAIAPGKSLLFEDEEIEEVADMQYGDKLTFVLLSHLFPFIDHHYAFDIDHIFPKGRFTEQRLKEAGVPSEKIDQFIQCKDGLANLQLLANDSHLEKGTKLPAEWLQAAFPNEEKQREHENLHLLGHVPESMTEFLDFYEARRDRLKDRITALLGRGSQPTTTTQE